nr:MAG TPA: neurotoxin [Caudoviricetes sp.]
MYNVKTEYINTDDGQSCSQKWGCCYGKLCDMV